jgi:hypothetical protein
MDYWSTVNKRSMIALDKAAFYDRGHRASFDSIFPGATTAKGGSHG